jgi:hypothetical protein
MWPFSRKSRASSATAIAATGPHKKRVLSFVSPQEAESPGGIPLQAIVGDFVGAEGDRSVESFRPNPVFETFLHDTIRIWGPDDPELRASARHQSDGWVYIIDLRTPEGPLGRVPPEDIIGAFQVIGGLIVAGSYQATGTHLVYSRHGVCQLPGSLTQALVRRLPRVTLSEPPA